MSESRKDARSLEIALNAAPVGISWANLTDQKIVFMNRKFTEIFGYSLGEFDDIPHWIEATYPFEDDRALASERWIAAIQSPSPTDLPVEPMELRICCKDGTVKTILHSGVILPEAGWALATFVDISDRKRDELHLQAAEREARENRVIYSTLLDNSPEMIVLSPFDQSTRYVSPAVEKITGFTAAEYLATPRLKTLHPGDVARARELVEALRRGETVKPFRYRLLRKDGGYAFVEALTTSYADPMTGETAGYIGNVRDISELMRLEDLAALEHRQLSEDAGVDELTGISNRRTFNQTLTTEALRQSRSEGQLSVLLLDVDYFKQFNDRYGHIPGDLCLKSIAQKLKSTLRRSSDLAARFGGEEFVVLAPTTDASGARIIANNILCAIADLAIPHEASPLGVVTVSIGVASWPVDLPVDRDKLLQQADLALYKAKHCGRNQIQVADWIDPSGDISGS